MKALSPEGIRRALTCDCGCGRLFPVREWLAVLARRFVEVRFFPPRIATLDRGHLAKYKRHEAIRCWMAQKGRRDMAEFREAATRTLDRCARR